MSSNTLLYGLLSDENQIASLDLSNNPGLFNNNLRANDYNLSFLNIANGNNAGTTNLFVINNPNLRCIKIDSGFTPPTNGTWVKRRYSKL